MMPASMKRTPSEDLLDAPGGRRRDGVAFDEDRLRVGAQDGIARSAAATSMATPGGTMDKMKSALAREEGVVVDDLDAGALDPLDARRAAAP